MRQGFKVMAAINVLIVDDESSVRRLLVRILSGEPDLAVAEAASGGQACALASRTRYDAVICDLYLPDIDGLKLIKKLQTSGVCPPLIMMLSGALKPPEEKLPPGAIFINKPFIPGDITAPLAAYARAARQPRNAPAGQS